MLDKTGDKIEQLTHDKGCECCTKNCKYGFVDIARNNKTEKYGCNSSKD